MVGKLIKSEAEEVHEISMIHKCQRKKTAPCSWWREPQAAFESPILNK